MSRKSDEWTVLSMLEWATEFFKKREVASPRMSIEWLLADVLNIKRLDLYLAFDRPLSPDELDALRPLVKRRAKHEPLQYITGSTTFVDVELEVTRDVLIPRMETEQLVEIILDKFSEAETLSYIDIGTGSGCIPIAIQDKKENWIAHAIDTNEEALELARSNAARNEVSVNFKKASIFNWDHFEFDTEFDFIVSNPPYVLPDEKKELNPQVLNYEPHEALFCEDVGQMYGAIVSFASAYLKLGGLLFLEINAAHATKLVSQIKENNGWSCEVTTDYDGKQRFIQAQNES